MRDGASPAYSVVPKSQELRPHLNGGGAEHPLSEGGISPAYSAVPKSQELLESLLTVALFSNSRGVG